MIIFIEAKDSWRGLCKKREFIENFQQKYLKKNLKLEIKEFDLEKEDHLDSFFMFLKNQSLFEDEKFGVVYNLFIHKSKDQSKDLKKELLLSLKNPNLWLLIYEQEKPKAEFNFLTKPPVIYEQVDILKGIKWTNFALAEIKKRNINITSRAAKFLINIYAGDSFRLITEIEKLSFINKKIDLDDLNNLNIESAPDFWENLNQLKSKSLSLRIEAFEKILSAKEPTAKIFNILAYGYLEKLESFAIYDRAIKSGRLDYEEAILDLIL